MDCFQSVNFGWHSFFTLDRSEKVENTVRKVRARGSF